MIEALEKTLGIVTDACKMVGIARSTHYKWMDDDEQYKAEVEELSNLVLDFAESKLHENINNNDTTAIIFLLKTRGKKRGYVERQEIDANIFQKNLPDWLQDGDSQP
jgi:hypothetical protein